MEENNVQSTLDEQVVEVTAPTVEETPEKTADNAVEVNEEEPVSEETTEV